MEQTSRGSAAPGHDLRDRLILALYAQLKAERATREALEYVIRNGAISDEVLEAIASDPIPAVAEADIAAVEKIVAIDSRRDAHRKTQPSSKGASA
ncbi:hypothetical protein [Rhizobium sp. SSA_523]|uniref:hypothetical protein n=1 Tax=Rhizobium sp. SSA_523 TaxID=2952477 RepID=UPI00209174AC|nr:hypothetical protein [Rhizobium sp. SSA_523]MCO5731731.1 hypothetical protein [Rhizobium sp. SSA_523]WKC22896.1 hypothetical protein QTJ18_18880 [Rhizobium sp. SSA_523]